MPDNEPEVTGFFDPATSSISYLIADPATGTAAIVDPVLDFDPKAARTSTTTADRIAQAAAARRVEWILETHTHADHLSAASYLKRKLGSRIGIGAQVTEVQKTWERLLNLGADFRTDGSQFDHLFVEGEQFRLGSLAVTVWHTPGHTPACVTYVVKGGRGPACAFVGDTLFMPDYGTARADFPGGDARRLFQSIRRILSLPPDTRIFVAHDYQPGGRVRDHGCRAAAVEPARQGRRRCGRVRGVPHHARQDAGAADVAAAGDPGEHPSRRLATAGRDRYVVPEDSAEPPLT